MRADLVIRKDWLLLDDWGWRVRSKASFVLALVLSALNLLHEVLVDDYCAIRLPKHVLVFN